MTTTQTQATSTKENDVYKENEVYSGDGDIAIAKSVATKVVNWNYSTRAIAQDAALSIRGKLILGAIELITNGFDANINSAHPQKIPTVSVTWLRKQGKGQSILEVRDRAGGIPNRDLLKEFGSRSSGFEKGKAARGNQGRGIKDCTSLGRLVYHTIHEGVFETCEISDEWGLQPLEARKRPATNADRKLIGLRSGDHGGTLCQLYLNDNVTATQTKRFKRELATHFALRPYMNSKSHSLIWLGNGTTEPEILEWVEPKGKVIYDGELKLKGYKNVRAHLTLKCATEPFRDGPTDPYSPCGIVVRSEGTYYQKTMGGQESNPYTSPFYGELRCDAIDDYARDYWDHYDSGTLEKLDDSNPLPIIMRIRTGINKDHLLAKALDDALAKVIKKSAEDQKDEARRKEGQVGGATGKLLEKSLGPVCEDLLEQHRAKAHIEPPQHPPGQTPAPLAIVPEKKILGQGEEQCFTVRAQRTGLSVGDDVIIAVTPNAVGVLDLPEEGFYRATLGAVLNHDDLLTGQAQIQVLPDCPTPTTVVLTAGIDGREAEAVVDIIARKPASPRTPPETLEFERPTYSARWQTETKLHLLAPASLCDEFGSEVALVSSNADKVAVLEPNVKMRLNSKLGYCKGTALVEARQIGGNATITARLGSVVATAQVKVTQDESKLSFKVVREEKGTQRGYYHAETNELVVFALHPGLLPFIGTKENEVYSEGAHVAIANALSEILAAQITQEYYQTLDHDGSQWMATYRRHATEMLPVLLKKLGYRQPVR